MMASRLKTLLLYSLLFISGYVLGRLPYSRISVIGLNSPEFVKTIAHIQLDSGDYRMVYVDTENDIAYYEVLDEQIKQITVGTEITDIHGGKGVVKETTPFGFIMECDTILMRSGESGKPVLHDSNVIGYVSEAVSDSLMYCIWK